MGRGVPRHEHDDSGFTLIEVIVAAVVLVVGLVAVAYGVALGLAVVTTSQQDTIARQKAREAMEDVFTARDTSTLTFDQICNVGTGTGCIFVSGFTALTTPGPDGIVNTADDGGTETVYTPGPDGVLGTADDVQVTLSGFQRQIQVTQLTSILKQVTVTIQYTTPNGSRRSVTLVSLMSPYV
ncbi:MAG: prepilin-type N-terminal cleavage/methylation domain-containing protein [Terriglobia bacterium]|jgi:prepilin-type N-terminal cleavage/methylation domain-containing protein